MRAEDRYRLRKAQRARTFGRTLGAELRDGLRKPQFWLSLARNSIPLFGVFLWDWDALAMAVYFLLQSWLMGALYCAIDLTFNPDKGTPPRDMLDALGPLLKRFAAAALLFAVFVGIFGGFMLHGFFDKHELADFLDGGWRESSFLIGLAGLAVGCLAEATRFVRSLARRTAADIDADNFRFAATIQTVALLCAISGFLGVLARFALGSAAFVVAAVVVLTLFDAAPRSAAVMMGTNKAGANAV